MINWSSLNLEILPLNIIKTYKYININVNLLSDHDLDYSNILKEFKSEIVFKYSLWKEKKRKRVNNQLVNYLNLNNKRINYKKKSVVRNFFIKLYDNMLSGRINRLIHNNVEEKNKSLVLFIRNLYKNKFKIYLNNYLFDVKKNVIKSVINKRFLIFFKSKVKFFSSLSKSKKYRYKSYKNFYIYKNNINYNLYSRNHYLISNSLINYKIGESFDYTMYDYMDEKFINIIKNFLAFYIKRIFKMNNIIINLNIHNKLNNSTDTIKNLIIRRVGLGYKIDHYINLLYNKLRNEADIIGLKVIYSGRYKKKLRNKKYTRTLGRIAPANINSPISHNQFIIILRYGICGLKISFVKKLYLLSLI